MTNIFVSRPNWVHETFAKGLDVFLSRLTDLELTPRTLGATDYPTKAPLDEVIKLMEDCRGAVILGYPQIELTSGSQKGEPIVSKLLLSTEWNHIEAGIAYARGMPLLVIHHSGVARGIFDRGALNSFLFCRDLSDPAWAVSEEISGAVRSWRNEVLGFSPTALPVLNEKRAAIAKDKDIIWTAEAVGRKINDARPLSANYRESIECRITELNDFYVRINVLSSGENVTISGLSCVLRRQEASAQTPTARTTLRLDGRSDGCATRGKTRRRLPERWIKTGCYGVRKGCSG